MSITKYRRELISLEVEKVLVGTCEGIELRYDIRFFEIGSDKDYVHFLVQSVPTYSVTKVVRIIKNLIANETEKMISNYVKNQGVEKDYKELKSNHQLDLF